MLNEDSLGARIRQARLGAGYKSAQKLADKIGVSQSTISQLETETINPRGNKALATVIKLVQELKTDFGEEWLKPYLQKDKQRTQPARQQSPTGFPTTDQMNNMHAGELEKFIRLHKRWIARAELILARKQNQQDRRSSPETQDPKEGAE